MFPSTPGDLTDHTVIRARIDCAQLFNLYMGHGPGLMLPPLQFISKTKLLNRNLLSFRDRYVRFYQDGIGSNVQGLERFLSYQRQERDLMSWVKHSYCIGSSVGGYAAILSGHVNEAETVWAFAPPAEIPENMRSSQFPPPPSYWDLSELLSTHNGVTTYNIYYNLSEPKDVAAAERLGNLPGVKLHPQAGEGHGVIFELLRTGALETMMPDFIPADPEA